VALWTFYGPTDWLDYYDTHAILCTGYYTSHCIPWTWNQAARCTSLHAPKYTPDCTRWHTPSLLDLYSEVSSQDAPKYTSGHAPKDAANCTRWHTLGLLDLRSQVSSQDTPKCTPGYALNDTHNGTRWHNPSLLDCLLPGQLSRRSVAYSWTHSQVHSELHLTTSPSLLDCTFPRRSHAHSRERS